MPLHSDQAAASSGQQVTEVLKRAIATSITSKLMAPAKERKGLTIFNHSTSALYIDFGASVSLTDFAVRIPSGGYYEMPFVVSTDVRGIWEQGQGKAFIREMI
ncbi:hypothetical protein C7B65_06530 [Phormidesmis priestleyi ULC007]|uniref:Uncharacterized protein n=1 Tax=Phormidesmis priestleyi ULC007 TaxID=1920490 RepID=A0A2T1DJ92_9CYAN|nr:hypothetical protein [Phormidesmis priestleyi]PSB20557.1 hypothetical protein C7B65_06530 [Phormidesmis priestleyi ULC007]PZO54227.1 MAG: hypothetical protein DCF14_02175 [Phormidesmis priestleyi]